MAIGYTTVSLVAEELQTTIDTSTTPDSDTINNYIEQVESILNDMFHTTYTDVAVTDYVDIYDPTRIRTNYRPIISIDEFAWDKAGLGQASNWETLTEGREGSFLVNKEAGLIKVHKNYPSTGEARGRVKYTYGYEDIPYNVQRLATLMVVRNVIKSKQHNSTFSNPDSISIGEISITRSSTQNQIVLEDINSEIEFLIQQLNSQSRLY